MGTCCSYRITRAPTKGTTSAASNFILTPICTRDRPSIPQSLPSFLLRDGLNNQRQNSKKRENPGAREHSGMHPARALRILCTTLILHSHAAAWACPKRAGHPGRKFLDTLTPIRIPMALALLGAPSVKAYPLAHARYERGQKTGLGPRSLSARGARLVHQGQRPFCPLSPELALSCKRSRRKAAELCYVMNQNGHEPQPKEWKRSPRSPLSWQIMSYSGLASAYPVRAVDLLLFSTWTPVPSYPISLSAL